MKKTCPTKISKKFSRVNPGFTLIELLIAISITAILFSIGVAQYMKFNRQQILDQAVLELKTNLTQARNMALAGKKTCAGTFDGIWVVFDGANENYTIYSSCDDMDPAERVQISFRQLSQGVKIKGSPGDILFKSLTGGTDLDSDELVTLSLSGVGEGGVIITPSGKIELAP